MKALGLIETKGLVAAIESADAMLKAADVVLLEKSLAGGGLVTITVAGEVSAVQAAVDAAAASVRRISGATLISRHVIARPDAELERIVVLNEPLPLKHIPSGPAASETVRSVQATPAVTGTRKDAQATPAVPGKETLKRMNMADLRKLAAKLDGMALSGDALASANKKSLIEAILTAARK